eukprot:7297267-Pyramimonas_sp.AAC.1
MKSLPAEQEKRGEQRRKRSADRDFRAQQQKLLDECSADKLNVQRMKEQADKQIRLGSDGQLSTCGRRVRPRPAKLHRREK